MTWVVLLVAFGALILIATILAIILVAGRARPQAGLGTAPGSDGSGPLPPSSGASGTWNIQILGDGLIGTMGGSIGASHGRVHLADGAMTFTPDDGTPGWRIPCDQVAARSRGMFSVARVELMTSTGRLRCNVSREHINRVSRNQIKTQREVRYAREFVQVLGMNGAHVG